MLSLLLLGSPQLLLNGRPLSIARRKSRAVLYQVAAQAQPIARDRLLTLFWPDLDRPAAQQTLRTTLHGLRKALGSALIVDGEVVALAADVDVDVRRFESILHLPLTNHSSARLQPQSLLSALSLYRGDFLDGFALPDLPAFDDWIAVERERYRRLAVRGFTRLAEMLEAAHDFAAALAALDRALRLDPLQEDLQRAALRLHYLAGDRAGAIRRYENLRKLLAEELGVPPMAETRTVYDAIINDTLELPTSASPISTQVARLARHRAYLESGHLDLGFSPLPFIGRAAELQRLRDALAAKKLALIEGEPGIGKTRLAQEIIQASDALPLVGAAHELESGIPYQPISEALRGLLAHPEWPALHAGLSLAPLWLAEVSRLAPELTPGESALPTAASAEESRLWEASYQLLLALSKHRRVFVFLDDLHWADASTLGLLGYWARRAGSSGAPISLLAAARPALPRSPLTVLAHSLTREDRLARIALGRFSADETLDLARRLSPDYGAPLAEWLGRNAEGNPYILAELVRWARENGILLPDGVVNLSSLSAAPVLPQPVYSLIQLRLARLSEAARRVLDAAVAAGREFEFEVVARAVALSESAALDALDELRASGLIHQVDGLRYAFDHSLTMEVAYREVGEARHRLLHRHVAEAMESVYRHRIDSVAGAVAWHFIEGNAPERAAPYAFRAGQLAERLAAWREAIGFYEQALNGETDDPRRQQIYLALGRARYRGGQGARAAEALQAALSLAQARGDAAGVDEARLELGNAFLTQSRFADVMALARRLRDEGLPENAVRAEVMWGTALSIEGTDLAAAAEHLSRAAALCTAQADPATLAQIKFESGSVAAQQGDLERAIAYYRESLAVAESAETPGTIMYRLLAHNNLAYHLHLLGDPSADEHLQAGLSLARERGELPLLPYLLSTSGEMALARGDEKAAERDFNEGLALAEQLSNRERIAGLTANLGLVARARGETALAVHRLSTALAQADSLGIKHLAAQIRLWLAPLLPPAEARARLAEAREIAEAGGRRRLLEEIEKLENPM